jgi:hypothetical protein
MAELYRGGVKAAARQPRLDARLPQSPETIVAKERDMRSTDKSRPPLLCPSMTSIGPASQVFGVLTGTPEEGFQIGYLTEAVPVTPELLDAIAPAKPSEVLRVASPCIERACKHFDGADCQLGRRIATMLQPAVGALPRCAIRPRCRWFHQDGPEACRRCPLVATEQRDPTDLQRTVAGSDGE